MAKLAEWSTIHGLIAVRDRLQDSTIHHHALHQHIYFIGKSMNKSIEIPSGKLT